MPIIETVHRHPATISEDTDMNIRISGAICGHMWMPSCKAGLPGDWSVTNKRARFTDRASIAETVESILIENGGDFQDPAFTADSLLIFEYRRPTKTGYVYGTRQLAMCDVPSLADHVDKEAYVSDFMNDDY